MSVHLTPVFFTALLSGGILLSGCSDSKDRKQLEVEDKPLTTGFLSDNAFAAQYFVADEDCQGKSDAPILTGKGINVSFYNFYQRTTCTSRGGSGSCDDGAIVSDAEHLRVCPSKKDYPRNSVEGVGRTALGNIGLALRYYETIPTARSTLPNSSLLVLPRVETVYSDTGEVSVSVDNLAYAPDYRGMPTFVIYPKGAKSVREGKWVNVNFWEIPWAIAHEFGHHVFNTHAGVTGTAQGVFGELPLYDTGLGLVAGAAREVTNDDLLVAINEGFADIYAYYTLGGDPGVTDPLDCFQGSRDTGSATFADGTSKILNADVLSAFTATRSLAPSSSCKSPSFQEVHTMGAVIAYGVDQIFTAALPKTPALNAEREKGKMLLAWAEQLGKTYPTLGQDSTNGRINLGKLIKTALRAAAPDGSLPAAACDAVRRVFAAYATTLLNGDISCES